MSRETFDHHLTRVAVCLPVATRDDLVSAAERAGLTTSTYLRLVVQNHLQKGEASPVVLA